MRDSFETVDVQFADGIGTLTLDRPDSLNALNGRLRREVVAGLERLDAENDDSDGVALRAVVLEGAGGNFCAGADVTEFDDDEAGTRLARDLQAAIMDLPAPVVAKIEGYCLGGGFETALACDFRVAAPAAELGFPEVDLGIMPGGGGVGFVSRLAGPAVAAELAMTGEFVTGERAADLGLVTEVTEDVDGAARDLAERLASKPPLAIQAIKESVRLTTETGLRAARRHDARLVNPLYHTDDHAKAARAFGDDEADPTFEGL
jgi:enoyl-CoA hydratase/carnithine racemase